MFAAATNGLTYQPDLQQTFPLGIYQLATLGVTGCAGTLSDLRPVDYFFLIIFTCFGVGLGVGVTITPGTK